jgi:hypothetical protein
MPIIDPAKLKQRNMGRVQANAVREEVQSLLAKGYSRRTLYAELREKGAFSGSYRRFCEYFRQPSPTVPRHEPEQTVQTAPVRPAASGFIHKKCTDNELL